MIIDLESNIHLDLTSFERFVDEVIAAIEETNRGEFDVAFVSDERMKELNKIFRGKDSTTDVLSFPHEPQPFEPATKHLGDIVISAGQAAKQAAENDLSLEGEIKQLILHGVLHLCGYDHEADNGEMNARELELREKLGI